MSATFANYDGKCDACGKTIVAGTAIVLNGVDEIRSLDREEPIRTVSRWAHDVCPPDPDAGEICPQCFLVKPCPCEDDQ